MWNNRSPTGAAAGSDRPAIRCSIPPSTRSSRPSCRRRRCSPTPEDTQPYECDGLTLYREQPAAVLLPENEAQVVAILQGAAMRRACRSSRAARAPSLSGGALPDRDGVVLSLAKFSRILAIDPLARTAVVQPGVRNLAISEAAAPLRPVLRARSVVADRLHDRRQRRRERRRRALPQVRAHRAQRAPRARRARSPARSSSSAAMRSTAPGYDLLALINGSEGLLAVITEITVKLHAEAAARAGRAGRVRRRRARPARRSARSSAPASFPAGLEMMDQAATRAVEEFVHADYPLDAAAVLLVESDGTPEEVAAEMAEITRVLTASRRDRDPRVEGRGASACCSGRGARRRFPRSAASRPTTTASTARSRARRCRACCARSTRWSQRVRAALRQRVPRRRRQPASADPVRRQRRRTRSSATERVRRPRSSSCASRSAARSPASTASASRSSTRMCAQFRAGRARALPRRQGGVRRRTGCSIRARRVPTLAPLRGVRQDARAPRPAAASRPAAVLTGGRRMNAADRSAHARPDAARRRRARRRGCAADYGERAVTDARDPRAALPRRGPGRRRAARRRRLPAHQRGGRGDRAAVPRGAGAGHRVRRRHVARGPRRGALRRRVHRPVADEPRARGQRRRTSTAACRRASRASSSTPSSRAPASSSRSIPGANATIGGMAATRASGTNAVRYGTMRENVLGPHRRHAPTAGSSAPAAARASRAPGYDLTRLFVGAEGTLGIITEIQLRLYGVPEAISAAVCQFDDLEGAVDTVIAAMQHRHPGRAHRAARRRADGRVHPLLEARGLRGEADAVLRVPRHRRPACAEQAEQMQAITAEHGGSALRVGDASRRTARGCGRRATTRTTRRWRCAPGKQAFATDACVPISRLADCLLETSADVDARRA